MHRMTDACYNQMVGLYHQIGSELAHYANDNRISDESSIKQALIDCVPARIEAPKPASSASIDTRYSHGFDAFGALAMPPMPPRARRVMSRARHGSVPRDLLSLPRDFVTIL